MFVSDSRNHDEAWFRLYNPVSGSLCVVCVQWFDYYDYNGVFLPFAFTDEAEADAFLETLLTSAALADFAPTSQDPAELSTNEDSISLHLVFDGLDVVLTASTPEQAARLATFAGRQVRMSLSPADC